MSIIKGGVALITGGSRGIGYEFAAALMKSGIKGIMIADINVDEGKKAVCKLEELGDGKVDFIEADVMVPEQVKNAFDATVQNFDQLDIVCNNAGVIQECNWEKMIRINYIGEVRVLKLAMKEYLPKYRCGSEGVIVNNASVVGIQPLQCLPVYSSTKHGLIGLTRAFGTSHYYKKYQARILAICPGLTETHMIQQENLEGVDLDLMDEETSEWPRQKADKCGLALIKAISEGKNGSIWITEGNEVYQYPFRDRFEVRKEMLEDESQCK